MVRCNGRLQRAFQVARWPGVLVILKRKGSAVPKTTRKVFRLRAEKRGSDGQEERGIMGCGS
jgi:hypothetical protein